MAEVIDFKSNDQKNKNNKKRIIITSSIIAIIVIFIILSIIYSSSKDARKFFDKYVFGKNVSEEKLVAIQLDYDSNTNVIAYNKYICILAENSLKEYNTSGELVNEIKLEINNPIYHVNDKYLVISEKNSSKIYLISDTKILWEKEIDGVVNKLDVNKNGYVTVIISGTTHQSVIDTYDVKGNELFKTYLASTTAMDGTISQDNKFLAFAEVDTAGTVIQSNIKIISTEKAKETETKSEAITYVYKADANNIITNIEYQNKKLICAFDNSIYAIADEKADLLVKLNEDGKKINFADIKLNNNIYRAIEKQNGLFNADTAIEMMNTESKRQTIYTVEGVARSINCFANIIAINLGQEIEFINTSGWLIKNYTSSQEVQDIVIGNNMAGIIYRDKVEIINL